MWKTFQIYLLGQLNMPKHKYKALKWKQLFNEAKTETPGMPETPETQQTVITEN